jgi:hypothetical protein
VPFSTLKLAPNFLLSQSIIEADILADGSLDYPDQILASFDFRGRQPLTSTATPFAAQEPT